MTKLIQICASENDLFGLDADGGVHQYNFNTNSWVRLGHGRNNDGGSPRVVDQPMIAKSEIAGERRRPGSEPPTRGEPRDSAR